MVSRQKQTFLQGALILVVGSFIVKIIGAIFKIPLTILIQDDGMGLFNASYSLYGFFVLAAKGISIAVSKMVSESVTLGKKREAERVFGISLAILGLIGLVGTGLLYFGADWFAQSYVDSRASMTIKAIAPSVLFVALLSAFRGYFQGRQNMYPTAFSEVIEAAGKLVIGIGFALLFIGTSIELAAVGAVLGVTISTLLSLLFVLAVYLKTRRGDSLASVSGTRSVRSIAKSLLIIALPVTIGASVASLTNIVDMMTIMNRLQSIGEVTPEFARHYASMIDPAVFSGGIYEKLANRLYGLYTAHAVQMFNLPLTFIVALSTSVLPAISGALTRRDTGSAQKTTQSVLRITVLISVPCAVGLCLLAGPVLALILRTDIAAPLLQIISIAIVFVSLVQVTNAILQAYGKMVVPVVNMIIGGVVKTVINYLLIGIPGINIMGAPVGTVACYLVITALNMAWIIKVTGCRFSVGDLVAKPLLAAAGMSGAVVLALRLFEAAGVSQKLAVLPVIAVGALAYGLLVLAVGAVKEADIRMMPKGDMLAARLRRLHLLRK